MPLITDTIELWLPPRIVEALHAHGIRTLADLTVRIPRRRCWWSAIAGLGVAGASRIEAFFAAHPALSERARALIVAARPAASCRGNSCACRMRSTVRAASFAPRTACLQKASSDYEARLNAA
ncbi:hypothetical protein BGV72_29075 [Burkholderia ubonensis]|nr:hypothetical protein BGV72_29075 [Burkholderia ubonensis]